MLFYLKSIDFNQNHSTTSHFAIAGALYECNVSASIRVIRLKHKRIAMKFLFPICLALLLLTSCKKDAAENYENTETVDATLIWSDPAVDGCGFVLLIGHEEYKPVNENDIPESYKAQFSTAVEATIINYHKQVNSPCGFITRFTNSIKILSLRKK